MSLKIDDEFLKRFRNSIMLLYLAMVITSIAGILFQEFPNIAVKLLLKYTTLGDNYTGDLFMYLFVHNLKVTYTLFLIMVFYGEKNFKILPKVYPIYLGIVGGIGISFGVTKANILYGIMAIMPHGIIELAVVCFALNSGYFFYKKEETIYKKVNIFIKITAILIFSLAIAAYIEAYITGNIASLFR